VHIQEHGVNYQQSITYDPWTQIARVHNPQHLQMDESITLMHKPSGMMIMLNNNLKHCEYSAMPEGIDPKDLAEASKEVEQEHKTLSMDLPETGEQSWGTVLGDTLTEEERDDLQPEMQTLCEGLDIFHINKFKMPGDSANVTELDLSSQGGRMKRAASDLINCNAGDDMVDKCTKLKWGRTCTWMVCSLHLVESEICASHYLHLGSTAWHCLKCCRKEASSALCKCTSVYNRQTFDTCQKSMDCALNGVNSAAGAVDQGWSNVRQSQCI